MQDALSVQKNKKSAEKYIQRHFIFWVYKETPRLIPCLLGVWLLAINDDSDNKSYSDPSDSDKLWGVNLNLYTK